MFSFKFIFSKVRVNERQSLWWTKEWAASFLTVTEKGMAGCTKWLEISLASILSVFKHRPIGSQSADKQLLYTLECYYYLWTCLVYLLVVFSIETRLAPFINMCVSCGNSIGTFYITVLGSKVSYVYTKAFLFSN